MLPATDGGLINPLLLNQYEIIDGGRWPAAYNEIVLVVDQNNEIDDMTLYALGLESHDKIEETFDIIMSGGEIDTTERKWSYEEIAQQEFYLIPECDFYLPQEDGTFTYVGKDEYEIRKLLDNAMKLQITAIVRPHEDARGISVSSAIGYTKALTDYIIDYTDRSAVVAAQKANPKVNVISGLNFSPDSDEEKIADAIVYIQSLGVSDKAKLYKNIMMPQAMKDPILMGQLTTKSETELAAMMDAYLENPEDKVLLSIYDTYISTGTYEENMERFGVVDPNCPNSINIYADSFEAKDSISQCISDYNEAASEENQITYTDAVALLMSSVTTIVDVISYVLIAFVSVSLVVSSIMIGIITYISVLERTKEIGILRAIGASKKNISQVFNAETFIIGLFSGMLGIGVTLLLHIPVNAIIHALTDINDVNASLPAAAAMILIVLSVILTLIGGLIPSRLAAKKDPVIALRTE
jgi:putative ABC transport system permease protein